MPHIWTITAAAKHSKVILQKLKIEIPYDAAIPFQAIYIKMVKTGLKEIYVHTCP